MTSTLDTTATGPERSQPVDPADLAEETDDFEYAYVQDDDMAREAGPTGLTPERSDGPMLTWTPLDELEDPLVKHEANFEALRRAVQVQRAKEEAPRARPQLTRIPEVLDDFMRNFFLKHRMPKTLDAFELEWYEMVASRPEYDVPSVPDVYLETAQLLERVEQLEEELKRHMRISNKTTQMWEQVKKERDFHKANHHRLTQDKSRLTRDLKRLQAHAQTVDPTLQELRQKYETNQKEKLFFKMTKEKLEAQNKELLQKIRVLEQQSMLSDSSAAILAVAGNPLSALTSKRQKEGVESSAKTATAHTAAGPAAAARPEGMQAASVAAGGHWPPDKRPNPYTNGTRTLPDKPVSNAGSWVSRSQFTAHSMGISRLALHPKRPLVATSSDDGTWRLSTLPQGDLIMSGEGHKGWVSGIAMHPKGTMLATGASDTTVKLWDFSTHRCRSTFRAHTEGVWCLDFQEAGDLLVSGSLDHTARIWDVEMGKCKATLRGHVDAVNGIAWQRYTNTLCTGSGDKTVSLWDARANFCVQTFYGHRSAITSVATDLIGDSIASCDTEGNVIIWDVRMLEQKVSIACGPHAANSVDFDASGYLLAVASDDTTIKLINLKDDTVAALTGHEDAVQCAKFDPDSGKFLVSCGSDAMVRYWS